MTRTVRWFKNEKGYGRINGDDGYIYWCHFSAIDIQGYKTLQPGQLSALNGMGRGSILIGKPSSEFDRSEAGDALGCIAKHWRSAAATSPDRFLGGSVAWQHRARGARNAARDRQGRSAQV